MSEEEVAVRAKVVHNVQDFLYDFGTATATTEKESRKKTEGSKNRKTKKFVSKNDESLMEEIAILRRELSEVRARLKDGDTNTPAGNARMSIRIGGRNEIGGGGGMGGGKDTMEGVGGASGGGTTSTASGSGSDADLDPDERVIAQGWMQKKGRKVRNWKRRWFVLKGSTLSYYKTDNVKKEQSLGDLNIETCLVDDLKEREDSGRPCMALIVEGRKLLFYAETEEENHFWYLHLISKQAELSYMRKLRMSNKESKEAHIKAIQFLRNPHVKQLCIDQSPMTLDAIVAISSPLRYHSMITVLSLCFDELGDLQIQSLCEALGKNSMINTLLLEGNCIGEEGGKAIAKLITQSDTLAALNIAHNRIGDLGLKAISMALPLKKKVTELILDNNDIGPEGVEAYMLALPKMTGMSMIALSGNAIGNKGVESIANGLKNCSHIQSIKLRSNAITGPGALKLAEALKTNNSVSQLELGGNRLDNECIKQFTQMIVFNRKLTHVDYGSYSLDIGHLSTLHLLVDCGLLKKD